MGINTSNASRSQYTTCAYERMDKNKKSMLTGPNIPCNDINLMDIFVIKNLYKSVVYGGDLESCNLLMDVLPEKIKDCFDTNLNDKSTYKKMLGNILEIQLEQNFSTGHGRVGYYLINTNLSLVNGAYHIINRKQFMMGLEYLKIFDEKIKKFPLTSKEDMKLSEKILTDKLFNVQYLLVIRNLNNAFILNPVLLDFLSQF